MGLLIAGVGAAIAIGGALSGNAFVAMACAFVALTVVSLTPWYYWIKALDGCAE